MKHSDMIAELLKDFDSKFPYQVNKKQKDRMSQIMRADVKDWLLTAFTTIQERTEKETIERVEKETKLYWEKNCYHKCHSGGKEPYKSNWHCLHCGSHIRNGYYRLIAKIKRQSLNKMKGNV